MISPEKIKEERPKEVKTPKLMDSLFAVSRARAKNNEALQSVEGLSSTGDRLLKTLG